MELSEDKTTLMGWISNKSQEPLTPNQAITGAVNLYVEICAMMKVCPYEVLNTFWEEAADTKAADADGEFS